MHSSPKTIRDNPYVPPVVITSFKIFNKPVPIGAKSVLTKAISYIDALTLSYRDNVFSFEFAALSYANSRKNRYRYKLENFEPGWNEVGSEQRLATYTNLDPGKYVFRVQGSNSDGVWNEEGVSLPIVITPPWWRTNWFRAISAGGFPGAAVGGLPVPHVATATGIQEAPRRHRHHPGDGLDGFPDGSNEFVNRRWAEFTGLSAEDTAGSGWRTAVHPEDLQAYQEKWRESMAMASHSNSRRAFVALRAGNIAGSWLVVCRCAMSTGKSSSGTEF